MTLRYGIIPSCKYTHIITIRCGFITFLFISSCTNISFYQLFMVKTDTCWTVWEKAIVINVIMHVCRAHREDPSSTIMVFGIFWSGIEPGPLALENKWLVAVSLIPSGSCCEDLPSRCVLVVTSIYYMPLSNKTRQ